MSPGTSCPAGISASWPSRLTLAVMIIIFCRAAAAAAALPSWCRPITALNSVSEISKMPVPGCLSGYRLLIPREQHDLHRVTVLADERAPAGLGLGRGELVRAGPPGPRGRLSRAQATLPVHPFGAEDLAGAEHVPREPAVRRLS